MMITHVLHKKIGRMNNTYVCTDLSIEGKQTGPYTTAVPPTLKNQPVVFNTGKFFSVFFV